MKRIAGKLALSLVSLLLLLLVAEIGLRVLYHRLDHKGGDLETRLERSEQRALGDGGQLFNMSGLVRPSRHDDVVFELKPGLRGRFRDAEIQTSELGIRDRSYPVKKGTNVYRIVGLGDSVMFGWGVDQGLCFMDLIEARLNAESPGGQRYEALNFAVPGYNTTMEVATLEERALAFAPDLVIIHVVHNDFGVPLFMNRPRSLSTLRESYLLQALRAAFAKEPNVLDDALVPNRMRNMDGEEREEVLNQYRHMVGAAGFRSAMARLAAVAEKLDIAVILLIGSRDRSDAKHALKAVAEHGFHLAVVEPYSNAYFEKLGIADDKQARRKAIWVSLADSHPNAIGHRLYADAIMDALRELGVATPADGEAAPVPAGQ